MTSENQLLLDAIREVATQLGRLEMRLETRMDQLDGRMDRLEERIATIDTRISHLEGDFRELRQRIPLLEEHIDISYRMFKSDLGMAFSDMRRISQDRTAATKRSAG